MKNDGIQNSEVYENVLSAEKNADSPTGADSRVLSIDRMRGICIFIMVGSVLLSMFGDTFKAIAGLYGHGASGWQVVAGNAHFVNGGYSGIAFADVFAPLFIFVIGLTFCSSFKRREQMYGATRACFQLGVRFAALTGFGAVVDGVSCLPDMFGGKWSEMQFADKFFGLASFVLIAALLVLFVSQFVKNRRFGEVCGAVFRYIAAALGLAVLFFALCGLGEKIGQAFGTQILYETSKYGFAWDTLQNIGLAGLLALPFVKTGKWGRLAVVAAAYAALTVVYQHNGFGISEWVLEGGIVGGIGWAGILLLGSVFRDIKEDGQTLLFWLLSAGFVLVSVVLITFLGFIASKRGCTPVYCVFCAGIGGLLWGALGLLDGFKCKFALFTWWGGSCFLTYVLSLAFGFAMEAVLGSGTSVPLALAIGVVWLALMTLMNWLLAKKGKHVKI